MPRRPAYAMTEAEVDAFLRAEKLVTCATIGPNGRPHLMPLWYVVEDKTLATWTFGKSQKAKNLERLPQATLQVEAGTQYMELRGVMLECDVELIRELAAVTAIGMALGARYTESGGPVGPAADRAAGVAKQAPKRIGLRFHPTRVVSWDHRKLAAGA